ncbi:MAG TPA: hypothetical protein ENK18_02195 [Deltaproteobacteria bacterium]|nr:hypothetical protein [Deltaproteobacteria bacterium]
MVCSWSRIVCVCASFGLIGCGGDVEETATNAGCETITLMATVVDTFDAPIEGATVEWNNEECSSTGPNTFDCLLPGPGDYNIYAFYTTEYEQWGMRITADCAVNPMTLEIRMNDENGGM